MAQRTIFRLLFLLLIMSSCPVTRAQEADHLNFLAMGDWGSGNREQKDVADALAKYTSAQTEKIQAMLLVGDNFYMDLPGGVTDKVWQDVFENMYDPAKLDFPFYAVLGNHDYQHHKDAVELDYAKVNPRSRWKLPARWYRLDFPVNKPLVTVLMLDSDRDLMSKASWADEAAWLESELQKPRGAWTFCCAHHPLYTNGGHGDNGPLKLLWGKLFEKYKVDFYIAGHDHDLQQLQVPELFTSFVVVGGGGAGLKAMLRDDRGPMSQLMHGFGHLRITEDAVDVKYITTDGKIMHEFRRDKSGKVNVLIDGGRMTAVLSPLRALEGFGQKLTTTQPAGGD